jgi:hypothetical protein
LFPQEETIFAIRAYDRALKGKSPDPVVLARSRRLGAGGQLMPEVHGNGLEQSRLRECATGIRAKGEET